MKVISGINVLIAAVGMGFALANGGAMEVSAFFSATAAWAIVFVGANK